MTADSGFATSTARATNTRRDAYYLRFVAGALSFALFGLAALTVGLVVLPIVKIVPASSERKRERARAAMRIGMRGFVGFMRGSGGMTYEVRGVERLGQPGQIIVANHPTLIDVCFLLAYTPSAVCVVKKGLWRNPLTRWAVTLAEYITNDPTAAMIAEASAALAGGQTLIMFPEGTRTRPHEPMAFQRGAANIALRAARVLTPVYIRTNTEMLHKGWPWYRVPARRPHMIFQVGQDIDLAPFRNGPLPIASRALNEKLQALFEAHLSR
jgi:1-acyl-sn-glycerol-3-phosphate acyltransferase